ncbi:MAG: hypothetical protein ACREDY_09515 [Bradyrhizobium sp.]
MVNLVSELRAARDDCPVADCRLPIVDLPMADGRWPIYRLPIARLPILRLPIADSRLPIPNRGDTLADVKSAWIALAACAAVTAVVAQVGVNINALGPQVGGRAIPFRLTDQHGVVRTLDTVAGPKGTMLVFFRSASW